MSRDAMIYCLWLFMKAARANHDPLFDGDKFDENAAFEKAKKSIATCAARGDLARYLDYLEHEYVSWPGND